MLGLLASLPVIGDSELGQADDEPLLFFTCSSFITMTKYDRWSGLNTVTFGSCYPLALSVISFVIGQYLCERARNIHISFSIFMCDFWHLCIVSDKCILCFQHWSLLCRIENPSLVFTVYNRESIILILMG